MIVTQDEFDLLKALHGPAFDEFEEFAKDPVGAARRGEKVAALRLFLRYYREERPEVLSELHAISEQHKADEREDGVFGLYQSWIEKLATESQFDAR